MIAVEFGPEQMEQYAAIVPYPRPALIVMVSEVEGRDELLVARLMAGDEGALDDAFTLYAPVVFGLARRVTGSVSAAEDVVQEVFTALWRHPERFDPARGSLRGFLGVQAHRRAVDALRGDSRRRALEERHEILEPTATCGADGMDSAVVAEVVRTAIARLPEEQRRAVELAFWRGCTCREVADLLGISEGTVKSRLRLARAKLNEWLAALAVESV